ncbi:hypothetical protein OS493_032193 [Desmophyllum pertusum]|uniref:Uncharacterized protein n=1 Tax=Desmophyllum pertusum TaxID=174260 RepID=A0A9X0D7F3_9CNID|nr:hypothetical protein OS493_032193 [Desmophyllum pertusum]
MSERKKRGLTVPEIESSLTVPEMHSGDIGTARPVPKSTQMALSSELGTPDMHHVWRLEHSGDEAPSRSASVESLIDDDSDTGMRPVAGKKRSTKRRFTGLLRVASKDKYHLRPHTASTPASSDDEMETSFTTAEKGLTNPLYDAGQDCSRNNFDAESPQGLTSRGRRQRRDVPLRNARADYVDTLDGSYSTKIEEKKSSTVQSTVSDTPTNTAEDTTMKTTNESEAQERK